MSALLLALALSAPARSAGPGDAALLDELKLKEAYLAMETLKPRIDALVNEVVAIRDSHAGKAEPDPGGERRRAARRELSDLQARLTVKRREFRDLGYDSRVHQLMVLAMQVKEGKNDKANNTFQGGVRHVQIVAEYKDYAHAVDVALDEEQRAYQEAVARWGVLEGARSRRRRLVQGGAAAAVMLPTALWLWRRRGRALPAPVDADRVGRWHLGSSPKAWTFGTRWDGADGGGGSTASVRLFDERLCAPPSSPERLLTALSSAGPGRQPGLAAPVEAFAAGASVALVYPAAAGKPLSLWLEEGRGVKPAQAVVFLRRLAAPLDAAHRSGRAHGSLNPDCVLVGGDGSVLLEDFGVAAALTAAGARAPGSPAYAAPELASSPPSPAADLYSLGVLFYELVTGRHPFDGTNLHAMKLEKRYPPLSRAVPGCPPELDALLDGLLEPDPAHRRPAPGGLEAALRAL